MTGKSSPILLILDRPRNEYLADRSIDAMKLLNARWFFGSRSGHIVVGFIEASLLLRMGLKRSKW